jgi:penicillin amidase
VSRLALVALAAAIALQAEKVPGLKQRVEIIRDRWGVPHIYALNQDDLFFAQGWITAKDRLFQIDLWRRQGTGKLAEVLGPQAIARDRIARLVRFRGDWNAEWTSYAPDARAIVQAFTNGINAYIRGLGGRKPIEFRLAGYDPGLWIPEDVTARVAGLLMTRNLVSEINRSLEATHLGLETVQRFSPPDPFIKLTVPTGLDLSVITAEIVRDYQSAVASPRFPGEQGSNNWVISGAKSATGKPLLASDPHRPIQLPSLRKTVHLVAPGWNAIGAGEPALPGIALGHNDHIGFGFTIVGIDQEDLYVEKLNPANRDEYRYKNAWRKMEIEHQQVSVKGARPETVELRYTVHGPVIHTETSRNLAFALRWVGSDPGGAGYLAALSVARAKHWKEFVSAIARYKVPSENMIYADTAGNIGWIAAGHAPIRKNWSGLFPVPGENAEYEWAGYLPVAQMPQIYNPAKQFIATANHKILPPGYTQQLSYEWTPPFRFQRIEQMLAGTKKFTVTDFERMQHDVVSLPAKRLQAVVRRARPKQHGEIVEEFLRWDARVTVDSRAALVYEFWIAALPSFLFPPAWRGRANFEVVLSELEQRATPALIGDALDLAVREITRRLPDRAQWTWGNAHRLQLRHALGRRELNLEPVARPGDAHTVNAAGGVASGPSFRQILDFANWDGSVMTNVPGESGDPESKHYKDLLADWAAGKYHPMPFSRKAVEAAAEERIVLEP